MYHRRNLSLATEETEMGEAILPESSERNRPNPGQTLDIPNFSTSIWAVVLPNQVCKTAGAKIYGITAISSLELKTAAGHVPQLVFLRK